MEHDLLEKTLTGAVRALTELVHLTTPGLAVRSEAIRSIVVHITKRMATPESWQYELAATLSLIGCLTLPDDAFEKAYRCQEVSDAEDRMFRAHPGSGAHLLSIIPRLETVVEMIRGQMAEGTAPAQSAADVGARMLGIAVELDRRMFRGVPFTVALQELTTMSDRFDPAMLERWLDEHEYESVRQMRGAMSARRVSGPSAFTRANYMKVLGNYTLAGASK